METTQPTIIEKLTRLAAADMIAAKFKAGAAELRAQITPELVEDYTTNGNKSKVLMIGGAKVGTATLAEPKDTAVVDDAMAFQEWIANEIPDSVEIKVVVRANVQKALLEKGVELLEDGTVIYKKTGETIPGLKVQPGGAPSKFSITGKDEDALMQHAASLTFGQLMLEDLLNVPEVEAGATIAGEVITEQDAEVTK